MALGRSWNNLLVFLTNNFNSALLCAHWIDAKSSVRVKKMCNKLCSRKSKELFQYNIYSLKWVIRSYSSAKLSWKKTIQYSLLTHWMSHYNPFEFQFRFMSLRFGIESDVRPISCVSFYSTCCAELEGISLRIFGGCLSSTTTTHCWVNYKLSCKNRPKDL